MYMSAGDIRLDVVVVNFHSAALIARTIEIVHEFAGAGTRRIVVDNSPGDGAANIVRRAAPDATVIENPVNRGYAAAVNQAFMEGDGEFVLLINPDVQGLSGSYADVLEAFRDPLRGRGCRSARQYRRNAAAELHLCTAAIRPDLRGRGVCGAVPELATAAPLSNARLGPPATLGGWMRRGVPASSFAAPRSQMWACSTSTSSSTTRRPTG